MPHSQSVSIIIPALNEEKNIAAAVSTASRLAQKHFQDWEILIFNDGSTDQTGKIADQLALSDPHVKVTHHTTPRNLGACYKEGIQLATKDFVIMIPGDNENESEGLSRIFSLAGQADIIVPYVCNPEVRPWQRQLVSKLFVSAVNAISGQQLPYYNGTVLHKTRIIQACPIETDSFGYQAEALVKLLKQGHTHREVGITIQFDPTSTSKAFRPKNILRVGTFLCELGLQRFIQSLNSLFFGALRKGAT